MIALKTKRRFALFSIVFSLIFSPPLQATTPTKSYHKPLTIAAIALNVPYLVHYLRSKNENLYNRLSYNGAHQHALCNHALNLINFVALSSELPTKQLLLTGAILFGIQTSAYVLAPSASGVSLVWSGLTGMSLHRLFIQKAYKWHLVVVTLLSSATLVYYSCNAPAITTIAHIGGVAGGFGLSFLLPYKESALRCAPLS